MLAAFVESEPAAAAAVPFWHRWHARWLVPATLAAAAVVAWVMVPREGAQPLEAPSSTMARAERFQAPEPVERLPAQSPGNSASPAAPPPAADARARQDAVSAPPALEQSTPLELGDRTEKMTSSRAGAAVGAGAPQQAMDDARVTAPFAAPRPSAAAPPPAPASVAAPAASPPPPPPPPPAPACPAR